MTVSDELHRHHAQWLQRRRRLRRMLRPLPRRANLERYPVLKWFAAYARRAGFLWSFKRTNVLPSLYAGSVLAFLPLYGLQILLGFGAALGLRGNLTVMVALQMITNPLTIVPVYGFTAWVGLGAMALVGVGAAWPDALRYTNALFVGGVLVGLGFALLADLTWRLLAWEARVFRARLVELRRRRDAAPDSG
ncbi:MAG: DUF2062 domain-containing protein [Silanimonas sp.]